ncbi:hypothetical protein BLNAU_8329 [Blattamonas nauphoetae]|uniref:Uncharacterized protein n=1 Tax=Blattamonas nauphoetae TaxID=2049346 RepID=A0ABQ9XYZ7_9EUKA|nr:hypothetical protein BLNAU_8329 [Blattamonas nauphoetae]
MEEYNVKTKNPPHVPKTTLDLELLFLVEEKFHALKTQIDMGRTEEVNVRERTNTLLEAEDTLNKLRDAGTGSKQGTRGRRRK